MTVRLRPVTDADEPLLRRVFASSRERELAALPDAAATVFVDSQYELQRRHYLGHYPDATWSIIERDGSLIGRIIVDRSRRPILLVDLAILAQERRRGVGTALLRELADEARRIGTGVELTVAVDNLDARRLYERVGFTTERVEGAYMRLLLIFD
jgi:ribosomal protein S18 acetylase RimI-like enzyme